MIAVTGARSGLHWDMVRARNKGRIVYRHLSGLLRIVRGTMLLKAVTPRPRLTERRLPSYLNGGLKCQEMPM